MQKFPTDDFSVPKNELKELFRRIILWELIEEYMAIQKNSPVKKGVWYKKMMKRFSASEIEKITKDATRFLNEYMDWMQLEEMDWLAAQENEVLQEILTEDDHLDYTATDLVDKMSRRFEGTKGEILSTFKIKRRDN